MGKLFNLSWLVWALAGSNFLLFSILDRYARQRFTTLQHLRDFLPVAPALILLLFCLGGLRYTLSLPRVDATHLAWYNDRGEYTLVGTVSAPPDVRKDCVRYEISISELTDPKEQDLAAANRPIAGKALVTMPRWNQWQYGDQILFIASPLTPAVFPDFSYKEYLARQGVQSVIYYPLNVQKLVKKRVSSFAAG